MDSCQITQSSLNSDIQHNFSWIFLIFNLKTIREERNNIYEYLKYLNWNHKKKIEALGLVKTYVYGRFEKINLVF